MSRNFFKRIVARPTGGHVWMGLVLPAWVIAGFVVSQVVVGLVIAALRGAGVTFVDVNPAIFSTVVSAIVYLLLLVIVIGLPWIIKKYRTTSEELGFTRYPTWTDIVLAPAGFFVYMILSAIFTALAMSYLTFINFDQVQDTGFSQLGPQYEYLLAFATLVIVAPVAEEIIFRGYLLGKLRKHVPIWVAVLITSLLFAAVHLSWNVGIDVFALSLVLCLLRITTKSLWPAILLHMLKNGVAFYFLFINPYLLTTLGG